VIARPTTKRLMEIVALDPKEALGKQTKTLKLFKCEDGVSLHFVFYETRYSWYCSLHGRECPAVAQAKTYDQENRK
jgi:hypothetical protein